MSLNISKRILRVENEQEIISQIPKIKTVANQTPDDYEACRLQMSEVWKTRDAGAS